MSTYQRQDRFFKFDSAGPVEIPAAEAGYNPLTGRALDGITRVEYVDHPTRFVIHVDSQAPSWDWDRLTEMLNADQPMESPLRGEP